MLPVMICSEIPIEEIDVNNETFRISEEIVSLPIQASIREIGLLNPLLLLGEGAPYAIVCGFRRLAALRHLNASRVHVRIIDAKDRDARKAFDLALWDNLSHRRLDPLEKARVLYKLKNVFAVPDDALIRTYLPRLDLAPHDQVLRIHIMLHDSHPELRQCLRDGRLTQASMEYLAAIPASSQDRIAALMRSVRLSAGLQRKFFTLLADLAAMTGAEPGAALGDPEVAAVLSDSGLPPFQRGEKIYSILYRHRYPRVMQATELFLERQKSLGLPGAVRIVPAPYFETTDLRVEFNAPDVARFRKLAADLYEASRKPELDRLFEII
jgi:hypothetical protein